jgi:hypothetical protein
MKNRILQLAAVIILLAAAIPVAAAETRQVRIEWEGVKGARGYIVEIRNREGRELFKRNVKTSYTAVDLAPGTYSIKITALNVFMKPGSSSGWSTLTVKIKEQPREKSEGEPTNRIGRLGKDEGDVLKEDALEKERALKRVEELKREEEMKRAEALREEALKREEELKRAEALKREEALKNEEVRKKEEQARKKAEGYPRGLAGLGPLDIAFGGSYHFPVTGWKKYLRNTPGGHVMLSYRLSGIEAVKKIPVLSNLGFALQFGAVPFSGQTRDKNKMNLMTMPLGAGIFYDFKLGTVNKWAFDLRLAFLTGPSFSRQEIKGLFPKNKMIIKLYYDPQFSVRFAFDGYFFIEPGCGFQSVLFSGQALSSVYPFLKVGCRL